MGECGCAGDIENRIFKISDKYILVEIMPYCENCDALTAISISELNPNDLEIFKEEKISQLPIWMDREDKTPEVIINPEKIIGMDNQLEMYVEKSISNIYDKVTEKKKGTGELQSITDSQWDIIEDLSKKEIVEAMKAD